MQAEKRARFKSPHGLSGRSPSEHLPHLGSVQVKRAVVQVISAMAHHGYLEQPGGEAMIQYLVQQCALPPETEVRGRLTHLPCLLCWGEWSPEAAGPHGAQVGGHTRGLGLCTQQLPPVSSQGSAPRWFRSSVPTTQKGDADRHLALRLFC